MRTLPVVAKQNFTFCNIDYNCNKSRQIYLGKFIYVNTLSVIHFNDTFNVLLKKLCLQFCWVFFCSISNMQNNSQK